MVLIDMQPSPGLALEGNPGAQDFGEPVVVEGGDAEGALDLLAQPLAPRLGAEKAYLQRKLSWIDSLLRQSGGNGDCIPGRAGKGGRS